MLVHHFVNHVGKYNSKAIINIHTSWLQNLKERLRRGNNPPGEILAETSLEDTIMA
jgi:hypothetical protein